MRGLESEESWIILKSEVAFEINLSFQNYIIHLQSGYNAYIFSVRWRSREIFGILPFNINWSILGYKRIQNDRCNSEDTGLSK